MTNEKVLSRIGWSMNPEKRENILIRFMPLWIGIAISIITNIGIAYTTVQVMRYQLSTTEGVIVEMKVSIKEIQNKLDANSSNRWTLQDHKYYSDAINRELDSIRASIPPSWVVRDISDLKDRVMNIENKRR